MRANFQISAKLDVDDIIHMIFASLYLFGNSRYLHGNFQVTANWDVEFIFLVTAPRQLHGNILVIAKLHVELCIFNLLCSIGSSW